MKRARLLAVALVVAATGAASTSCTTEYQAKFTPAFDVAKVEPAPFLKAHLRDGSVVVLSAPWHVDAAARRIDGEGLRYDSQRNVRGKGAQHVEMDEVVLYETNAPRSVADGGLIAMGVITAASLSVTAFCAVNPKACFGSCPTFYAFDGKDETLQAEGFSASVARALEATDVDAMWTARPAGPQLDVWMTNDALETHAVDSVRVLAAPRPAGGRVLRAGDDYWEATSLTPPSACLAAQGDCTAAIRATDGREYKSAADAHDLATHETIDLRFDAPLHGRRGLLLVARNSLMNTFLFYQALAYMGRSAGEWIATLERAGAGSRLFAGLGGALGGIRVQVEGEGGAWSDAGVWDEVGPIALEAQVVPLPASTPDGPVHVRLEATQGYWRIDQAALVELGAAVHPVAIEPFEVRRDGVARPDAREALRPGGEHLVTGPRDAWLLRFELPPGDEELFLESRGYYYEWMRPSWLEEEDEGELARFAFDPRGMLRRLAPKYKRMEPDMDRVFWQSRLGAERRR